MSNIAVRWAAGAFATFTVGVADVAYMNVHLGPLVFNKGSQSDQTQIAEGSAQPGPLTAQARHQAELPGREVEDATRAAPQAEEEPGALAMAEPVATGEPPVPAAPVAEAKPPPAPVEVEPTPPPAPVQEKPAPPPPAPVQEKPAPPPAAPVQEKPAPPPPAPVQEKPAPPPAVARATERPRPAADGGKRGEGWRIPFDFNRSEISSDGDGALAAVIKAAKEAPGMKVVVEGHTDDVGPAEYNDHLGLLRARQVGAALVAQGLPKDRITFRSRGEHEPVRQGSSRAARAANRRVEIYMEDSSR